MVVPAGGVPSADSVSAVVAVPPPILMFSYTLVTFDS
jgi:hypothetical protein